MIKVLEQEYLCDNFINKQFIHNIKRNDKIIFKKDDIYYFGNYTKEGLNIIKKKLFKNKKALKNAIEKGIKIIINGNSIEIFNNNFNSKDINLFTCYNKEQFKNKKNGIKFNFKNKKSKVKRIINLNKPIDVINFRYKNMICTENIQELF